eukprot:5239210-Pleurochrysis_carterae.AAC.1
MSASPYRRFLTFDAWVAPVQVAPTAKQSCMQQTLSTAGQQVGDTSISEAYRFRKGGSARALEKRGVGVVQGAGMRERKSGRKEGKK